MRKKLIDILGRIDVDCTTNTELADYILGLVRCDKCEHWKEMWDARCCYQLTDDIGVYTKPDFFCAKWEPKN